MAWFRKPFALCHSKVTWPLALASLLLLGGPRLNADVLVLKNGFEVEGRVGKVGGVAENPDQPKKQGPVDVRLITFMDDDLRRTFFSAYQIRDARNSEPGIVERIAIPQRVQRSGRRVAAIGPIKGIEPFDEWGRRVFSMSSSKGTINVIQGITEITPIWTKLEGLQAQDGYVMDMRIGTSSIPRETLSRILLKRIDQKNPTERLRIVRLYNEAERFADAKVELEGVIRDFPTLVELQKEVVRLHQLSAQQIIREIELRAKAGQFRLVQRMLAAFPTADLAGETVLRIKEMQEKYTTQKADEEKVLKNLAAQFALLTDPKLRARLEPVLKEIGEELNINNYDRTADFRRLLDDKSLEVEQKLSLAVSGWLLGTGEGIENLSVSLSLFDVRNLVGEYLRSTTAADRPGLIDKIKALEGGTPVYVDKLLKMMKPPLEPPEEEKDFAGLHKITIPGVPGQPDITYYVQTPPDYDPYRKYPVVVALAGIGLSPLEEIEWWSGIYDKEQKLRLGQGSRQGYIVIAPVWAQPKQSGYEFSLREHATVLYSLRDACRKFSIHTDRAFIAGHGAGADMAWDIALAHPDLWAGAIPISATTDKYITRYWENGRRLPMYFVMGELDGGRMLTNSKEFDRYLSTTQFAAMVVEYRGRGHEHFIDEVQRIYQWMSIHDRAFFPKELRMISMRPWDNFYYWLELGNLPATSMVLPASWPPVGTYRPVTTEASSPTPNRFSITSGAGMITLWLSPEMVDFNEKLSVKFGLKSQYVALKPSLEVLLEDVRSRGDRQHPFWAKLEIVRSGAK